MNGHNPVTLATLMRGFVSLRTLIWLVVLFALGVVATAYGETALKHFRIKGELNILANAVIHEPNLERDHVERTLGAILQRTGMMLTRSDIVIRQDRLAETVSVEAHVTLATHFRIADKTIYRPSVITAKAQKMKSY